MAAAEVNVATAALAIAAVALVIALGQLIQQLFGTADGYRRVQSSVIGDWSKLVRLRFRWSSFRLEVKVTTPHFELCHPDAANRISMRPTTRYSSSMSVAPRSRAVAITGSSLSRRRTYSRPTNSRNDAADDDEDEDVVSWTILLSQLHDVQELQLMYTTCLDEDGDSQRSSSNLFPLSSSCAIVCITPKTRSWDLMPPDVVRPMASTTLGTLISMAHRMGMIWIDLLPRDGKLRAEGHGQSFSATLMRGMGIVVEYNKETTTQPFTPLELQWKWSKIHTLYVPSTDADKMACGIIPGNHNLGTWDIHLRSQDQDPDNSLIEHTLKINMQVGTEALQAIFDSVHHTNGAHHWVAFTDVLGLWSDWVPMEQSAINAVISPIGSHITTICEAYESRVVWGWLLRERMARRPLSISQARVLNFYTRWEQREPTQFYQTHKLLNNDPRNAAAKEFFKETFDETTAYFAKRYKKEGHTYYADLVTAHVKVNSHSLKQAEDNFNNETSRNDGRVGHNLYDTLFAERAFLYVDNIPRIVKEMENKKPFDNPYDLKQVEDAWWMLMLRGHCWEMGINRVVQKSCVPSSYYNSPARVYIL